MTDKLSKKEMIFEYPSEINDKNTLFTFIIRAARNLISSQDHLKGDLRPLGDIDLMSTSEAMKWIGIENIASFRNFKKTYEKLHGPIRIVGFQSPEIKHGPIFLREDLADFRVFVLGKKGINPFSQIQNQ